MTTRWIRRVVMCSIAVAVLMVSTGCGKGVTDGTRSALSAAATSMFNSMLQNSMYPNR